MHWPANDTVRYHLLLLPITGQTAVEYFQFQMEVAAAKKVFSTFLITRSYLFYLKTTWEWIWPPLWFFRNMYLLKRGWNIEPFWFLILWSFVWHLSWKFDWNSSSRSEIMKNLFVNSSYFHRFLSIFRIFWQMMSAFFNFQHSIVIIYFNIYNYFNFS